MSKLLLVEVWSDESGDGTAGTKTRPHASHFLGEATLELDLNPQKSSSSTVTQRLSSNLDIVKRNCTGTVTIKYEWTVGAPDTRPAPLSTRADSTGPVDYALAGKLTVSLLHANGLVNVFSTRKERYSNPYCVMLVYPTQPGEDNRLVPKVWRTPTVFNNLYPKWEKEFSREEYMHDFRFNWMMTERKSTRISGSRSDLGSSGGSTNRFRMPSTEGIGSITGELSVTKLDGVLGMLHYLENELSNVREDVVALHGRIDSYAQEGASVPKLAPAPPNLANMDPTAPNDEGRPESVEEEDPPVLLPGSIPES
eukprot:CAMPEP_0172744580 /NCGR_PEP_ID=MMETSP1074-20121228/135612_1 /TAXON_ID=2916 /ORGANISM="Ceratium fusus, Strain PA161109" /LENGTH=309 /DNA_ID=CAMNT_0013575567 /DNA_START=21 /DNA_END=950 /DNA_ORIENTATION=-